MAVVECESGQGLHLGPFDAEIHAKFHSLPRLWSLRACRHLQSDRWERVSWIPPPHGCLRYPVSGRSPPSGVRTMTTNTGAVAGADGPGRGGRMSGQRKRDAVLRLLRGEDRTPAVKAAVVLRPQKVYQISCFKTTIELSRQRRTAEAVRIVNKPWLRSRKSRRDVPCRCALSLSRKSA